MKMKKYYAINNQYGNVAGHGFAHTYFCLVFSSSSSRDKYVHTAESLAAQAIKKTDIGRYIDRPKAFSGMAFMIAQLGDEEEIEGCIGTVICGYPGDTSNKRLF